METRVSAERVIGAPAGVVYGLLADYREHHRPEGFLPPAFTDLVVEKGGVGEGTQIRVTLRLAGRSRTMTLEITEPEPGRVLVESGPSARTTFTVEPAGDRLARVRLDTVLWANGLEGLISRVLVPRLLKPLGNDELERLDRYARAYEVHSHS